MSDETTTATDAAPVPLDDRVAALEKTVEAWTPVMNDMILADTVAKEGGHSLLAMIQKVGASFFGLFR